MRPKYERRNDSPRRAAEKGSYLKSLCAVIIPSTEILESMCHESSWTMMGYLVSTPLRSMIWVPRVIAICDSGIFGPSQTLISLTFP